MWRGGKRPKYRDPFICYKCYNCIVFLQLDDFLIHVFMVFSEDGYGCFLLLLSCRKDALSLYGRGIGGKSSAQATTFVQRKPELHEVLQGWKVRV